MGMQVKDVPAEFDLITRDYEVNYFKDYLGKDDEDIGGLFLKIVQGEVTEAYGFPGIIPYVDKPVFKLC